MRFKFCGNLDAPDWFLQETVFLSQISAVRFKLIVIVVYRHLLGAPLEVDKLENYLKIMGESKTDSGKFFFFFFLFLLCLFVVG